MTAEEKRVHRNRQKNRSHVRQYRLRRKALIVAMGGECEECGKKRRLEFHHPNGRDWECRKLPRWQRIKMYERDFAAGQLELLCRTCNAGYNPKKEIDDEEYEDSNAA